MGEHVACVGGEEKCVLRLGGGGAWIKEATWKGVRVWTGLIWLGEFTWRTQ